MHQGQPRLVEGIEACTECSRVCIETAACCLEKGGKHANARRLGKNALATGERYAPMRGASDGPFSNTTENRPMSRPISTVITVLALSLPIAAQADVQSPAPPASLEAVVAASVDKPADHRALAEYYRVQAAAERSQAARLRSSARHLGGGKLFQVSALKAQRISRAKMLEASAREHEMLAAEHEEMAS